MFFSLLEQLMLLLSLSCILEVALHFTGTGLFDYFKDERFTPSTLSTVHPLLGLRGRPTGFSGSVYATSAMLAAFGTFYLNSKNYLRFSNSTFGTIIYATPSILIVFFGYIFISKVTIGRIVISIIVFLSIWPIVQYRLSETNELAVWLPSFVTEYSANEIFIGSFIGFGTHSPKIDTGEFRIFFINFFMGCNCVFINLLDIFPY